MRTVLCLLGLPLAFGCSGSGDSGSNDEADADTDSDSDTDADSDTDTTDTSCKGEFTDERDGRAYAQVDLFHNCWMAENLDYGEFLDNQKPGSWMIEDKVPSKYCYDYKEANCAEWGGLYEWGELMAYAVSDNKGRGTTQGLCPNGWHLPTDEEWKLFEVNLGMDIDEVSDEGWRGTAKGVILLKGANTGFEALLAGWRDPSDGATKEQSEFAGFWTSTADDDKTTWYRQLAEPATHSEVGRFSIDPGQGLSARCVRDALVPED